MTSATASKTIRGQIQNLHSYISLLLWRTRLTKPAFQPQRFHSNNLIDFGKIQMWKRKKYLCIIITFQKNVIFIVFIQKHWNQQSRNNNQHLSKFWTWPLIALEAVAEVMNKWSQWNFLKMCIRYQRKFCVL